MRNGFIKCAAATPEVRVADCAFNAGQAIEAMRAAESTGVRLLVLPELCVTGCTCGDLFLQAALLDGALAALGRIVEASVDGSMLTVVGLPLAVGAKLYSCAAVVQSGKLLGIVPKTAVSHRGDARIFSPAPAANSTVRVGGCDVPFGAKLLFRCADLPDFAFGVEFADDLFSPAPQSCALTAAGAAIVACPAASVETVGRAEARRVMVQSQSMRCICGYVYADAGEGESTTDVVYSGQHIVAERGKLLAEGAPFARGLTASEIDVERLTAERRRCGRSDSAHGFDAVEFGMPVTETALSRRIEPLPFVPSDTKERAARCEAVLGIQVAGLKKRLEHTHAATALIGISGGLDSTLALLVTARAFDLLGLPREGIIAVTMPGFGTTGRTKSNAVTLAELLGATTEEISITAAVRQHFLDIGQDESVRDVTYENAQARERTQILMDIANRTGGMVVGTGDLSEFALGWATYNGDHMSMYGVNAGVPKTLIRSIVRYCADTSESDRLAEVLRDILDTPVSPELLPPTDGEISQRTEDLVGPYELHDFFLYYIVRFGFRPAKVLRLAEYAHGDAYPHDVVLKWLKTFYRRFFNQQFKRSCSPDGPKVGSVSLSPRGDLSMPSDAVSRAWLDELETL